ncbi:MAG: helix-turn-helix domain-containing protein [Candidatus Onthovivens sp.]|nr:helix-turn-helix domain-containing protein [Candidatus Onthovivens sp.]
MVVRLCKKNTDEFKDGSEYKIIDYINEHRRLFIRLTYDNKFVGFCVILEINKNLDSLNKEFVKAASIIFAKSIYTFDPISKDISNETFLINLINHIYISRQIYLERLKRSNFHQNTDSYMFIFNIKNIKNEKEDYFLKALREINSKLILVLKEDYLICYLNENYSSSTFSKIDNLLFTYHLDGIVSSKILDLYKLDEIFSLNVKLLTALNNSFLEYKLYKEEDYKIILPFLEIDKNILFSFLNEKIAKLYHYDLINKTNYIDTLYAYILNERSLNEASKILYLHKNTILYRLDKIKNIANINLENYNEKLSYIFSIVLLYYLLNELHKINL